jgi:hypothetical protein
MKIGESHVGCGSLVIGSDFPARVTILQGVLRHP